MTTAQMTVSEQTQLYTYIVAYDAGSAPNPYHGICTLAICKPVIRRTACPGDIIVGLAPGGVRIVYAMVVDDSIPWDDYIAGCQKEPSLHPKIPKNAQDSGDCIWTKHADGSYHTLPSWSGHDDGDAERDIQSGQRVLLSRTFWYFGQGDQHNIELTGELVSLKPGRPYRSTANRPFREAFRDFFNDTVRHKDLGCGVHGRPTLEPDVATTAACNRCRREEKDTDALGEEE